MTDATLVDTGVLLDLLTEDPVWAEWSQGQLDLAVARGRVVINDVIYAETSVRFARIEDLDEFLADTSVGYEATPHAALFMAGKAHLSYRRAGGVRRGVSSDFFVGAHAALRGLPLLTRDPARFRTYFPAVRLIIPSAM